jgi:hypothetical protein
MLLFKIHDNTHNRSPFPSLSSGKRSAINPNSFFHARSNHKESGGRIKCRKGLVPWALTKRPEKMILKESKNCIENNPEVIVFV